MPPPRCTQVPPPPRASFSIRMIPLPPLDVPASLFSDRCPSAHMTLVLRHSPRLQARPVQGPQRLWEVQEPSPHHLCRASHISQRSDAPRIRPQQVLRALPRGQGDGRCHRQVSGCKLRSKAGLSGKRFLGGGAEGGARGRLSGCSLVDGQGSLWSCMNSADGCEKLIHQHVSLPLVTSHQWGPAQNLSTRTPQSTRQSCGSDAL